MIDLITKGCVTQLSTPKYDDDAWQEFPHHRDWFNKLWLSMLLDYNCGPCGVAPADSGFYCVRPIYNLAGMGVGARKQFISAGDYRQVEPGYFWCEWFEGDQHSVTYEWRNDNWMPVSSWRGERSDYDLSRFLYWERSMFAPLLPDTFSALADASFLNVEFVGGKIVEVHLRRSPDPEEWTVIIPVWSDEEPSTEGTFIPHYDDADGYLSTPRIGFIVY